MTEEHGASNTYINAIVTMIYKAMYYVPAVSINSSKCRVCNAGYQAV